jgi:hypothetical protein
MTFCLGQTHFSEATMRSTIYLDMFNTFGFPQLKDEKTEVSKQDGALSFLFLANL